MSLVGLFLLFAKTALLTFGGGYAMVPLFQSEIVLRHALLSAADFANLVALAQVTPGPIGFNAATYVGMTSKGFAGAVVASAGVAVPTFLVALAAAVAWRRAKDAAWLRLLMKGIRPCVVGVIASAVVFFADTAVFATPFADLFRGEAFALSRPGAIVFAVVLAIRLAWPKASPVWALGASALLGWALFL